MELTEKVILHLPKTVRWEKDGTHLFLDSDSPHWIATDSRGAQLVDWFGEGIPFGQVLHRYASANGLELAKAWLHVHDFAQGLLRVGFASDRPIVRTPYLGRAAYSRPEKLKELWLHTNNICNLACSHCLVSSAPWVKDWGLPADRLLRMIDEAVELGVERFYMTGGEPFLRRDIFTLIRHITESKGRELILLTNGTLFQGELSEAVKALDRKQVRFQVSVDGAFPETNDRIRGAGSFQRATEGLRDLAELGFQTSLTTVVTEANLKELPRITALAHRLGAQTQHLMWPHRRGRMIGQEAAVRSSSNGEGASKKIGLALPSVDQLVVTVREVQQEADLLGITVDNIESIKRRVNGRPGVKYDLGNACWDSLCIYSDGTVYPSAALANIKPLALGLLSEGKSIREIWERSPIAEAFRQASVTKNPHLQRDPFKYLTGGGDLEHSFWANLNGDAKSEAISLQRITELLSGPDPYYPVYTAMMEDAIWEIALEKKEAVNRRSGYDAPRLLHAMGDGTIHCAADDLAVMGEIEVRTLHSNCVLAFDVDKPRQLVRQFYSKAAETPQAELCCPTKFDPSTVGHIPKEVIDRFYGCGSPVTLGDLQPRETFVDLGSGAGIDCFIAAKFVGAAGKVIGVDMTDEMLDVANQNRPLVAHKLGYDVVEFRKGFLEQVPVESKSADLVTSNCVINLSPDKPKVFAEIWRILKDHGRVVIADIVSDQPVPAHLKVNPKLWGECTVGALTEEEFLGRLEEAGFYGLSLLKKSYWKSIEGYDFYSVTVAGYKFEKRSDCRFIGQRAIYLGPMKAVIDEEGHLFPRNVAVEVCTDTAAKLSRLPYVGSFIVVALSLEEGHPRPRSESRAGSGGDLIPASAGMTKPSTGCGPGCC
ncbi:MAG: methyltransferase domain-containing protein [Candidatus Omnitrophica bacterium]|nr:methyltransferase domain-containing protein [Candidatus Omnitrophota bacterium]